MTTSCVLLASSATPTPTPVDCVKCPGQLTTNCTPQNKYKLLRVNLLLNKKHFCYEIDMKRPKLLFSDPDKYMDCV